MPDLSISTVAFFTT